ncbi:Rho-type GTPase activating protein Rga1 [Rhodosporidiobolus nylandii]
MTGQFVRALGTVYHLDCFRCLDCNKVVAAKFFPIDDPSPSSSSANPSSGASSSSSATVIATPPKQVPLCETDYFRRLNLLCNKCGQALRGSYITALDMKFHVEHFTCSVCPTVFGPQDSYYEHAGSVYCHFHYSTRFAVKCTGCRTAILKQFVEINRNNVDEHWHPECYMIHKFWNIKLAPAPKPIERPPSTADDPSSTPSAVPPAPPPPSEPDYLAQESLETPSSLKARQKRMEEQVYRIWTILSAFEESSAACISEMLRHVSGGHYMEGVGMAEKFVLHVETLFAAIDDLNAAFRAAGAKEMSHVREARMLCKKVVNFFMLLSHTHETGARKMSITQELLSLVTGLAHYLKILIRIALSGALKLEREHGNAAAIGLFLGRLDRLARDPDANRISTTAAALTRGQGQPSSSGHTAGDDLAPPSRKNSGQSASSSGDPSSPSDALCPPSSSATPTATPTRQPYGYKSLTRAVGTLVGQGEATTDLCEGCRLTVEEECARLGTSVRWHLACLKCLHCRRCAAKDPPPRDSDDAAKEVWVKEFVWAPEASSSSEDDDDAPLAVVKATGGAAARAGRTGVGAGTPFCEECAKRERGGSLEGTQGGFEYVTRLEQYAFLLCVALNKLFGRLKQRGVVPGSPPDNDDTRSLTDAYRDSTDIKRMKSVQLDRKISSTTARLPKRSVVVQSPSGRTAQSDSDPTFQLFQAKPPVPSRKDQPLVDPVRGTVIPRGQKPPGAPSVSSPSLAPLTSPPLSLHPQQAFPPSSSPSAPSPQRPAYNRATTAVRIVDEPLPADLSQPNNSLFTSFEPDGPVLGGASEPTQDEDGLTLADLPKALEAEQKRAAVSEAQHYRRPPGGRASPPSHSQAAPAGLGFERDIRAPPSSYGPASGLALGGGAGGAKLLSELSALEFFIVKHVAAVLLASEPSLREVITLEELLEIIDARKNTFWGKLFKGGEKKKEVKKKGVFGIPLEILVDRNGADSMHGAGPGSLRIPSFVDDVISAMKQMDMSIEGIFRKNGNIRRLKDLTEALDRDSGAVNLSDDNPVQLAALLKKFLRDLPDPLMTYKLFALFIAAQRIADEAERKKVLHFCCCLMPKAHRDTMEVLFVFLKWVASFSHVDEETGSKMDLQNLATVISPNILYAKGKDPARDESFSAARVVHELLELQDEFWEVPAECLSILNDQELFANPSQLTSKEILARAENHVRINGRSGFKGSGVHVSRGEASGPQRPGLQEAWSAPAVPGSGPSTRPLSTSVSPSQLRPLDGRPLSISNHPGNAFGASHPHLPPPPPGTRSGASTPGGPPGANGGWTHAPPPAGRYEDPYRRGGSEGNASNSSLQRMPQERDPRDRRDHSSPAPHPYNQGMPVQQR